jgi:hypothetical protein
MACVLRSKSTSSHAEARGGALEPASSAIVYRREFRPRLWKSPTEHRRARPGLLFAREFPAMPTGGAVPSRTLKVGGSGRPQTVVLPLKKPPIPDSTEAVRPEGIEGQSAPSQPAPLRLRTPWPEAPPPGRFTLRSTSGSRSVEGLAQGQEPARAGGEAGGRGGVGAGRWH